MTESLHQQSLLQLAKGLDDGDFSARELTENLLARIAEHGDVLNERRVGTDPVPFARTALLAARAKGPLSQARIGQRDGWAHPR